MTSTDQLLQEFTDPSLPKIIKRDGQLADNNLNKVVEAVKRCCLDVHHGKIGEAHYALAIAAATDVLKFLRRKGDVVAVNIEDIQDQVELSLMRNGEQAIARAYVLFREARAQERKKAEVITSQPAIHIVVGGVRQPFDLAALTQSLLIELDGLDGVDAALIAERARREIFDGATDQVVRKAVIMSARVFIENDPGYDFAVSRLLMGDVYKEVIGGLHRLAVNADAWFALKDEKTSRQQELEMIFQAAIPEGVKHGLFSPDLLEFNLHKLSKALVASRDVGFDSIGVQTLYDRYLVHIEKRRIEVPQTMLMRVAMGLALNESNKEDRAIEFYNLLSNFDFMSSTPTLFNSGTTRPQLSSCYLGTVPDDLDGIYEMIKENALLSKFAGGLGNDWTRVRALGAHIKGTNGESQGVVPFLKVVNDTAVAVNQGGKRKGAVCTYLETWHLDIEEFLELRKNTGDDRRRTHDMNTANWIPDLFMRRVMEKGSWTLFSPNTVPDLHEIYGADFESAYVKYEEQASRGEIKPSKVVSANDLWRKMLTMLFETGHPWITFKDPCNIRSPQQHVGVVHSSNLCTEITLNTSDTETAVCNLGSVNLSRHLINGVLDHEKLKQTITTAMRMLDNVIDINFYAVKKSKDSNLRHRPVGMGIMAFQDCLHQMKIPYGSAAAVEFSDRSMEAVAYYAYWASSDLAKERGTYETYEGSHWHQGLLPHDTISHLAKARGGYLEVDSSSTMDWESLRSKIQRDGMRNSNCVAIAPTATISNIVGVDASIEPCFANVSVKSTLSGEFTIVNSYLVNELKALGLWDQMMISDLKHFDGSVQSIERIPQSVRDLFRTAFEIDPSWLIECASRRQKWIDQAQSLNIYMAGASGKKLDETYKLAWLRGLKTTYYLRTVSASNAEKSTGRAGSHNAVGSLPVGVIQESVAQGVVEPAPAFCSMRPGDDGFESCEACQ